MSGQSEQDTARGRIAAVAERHGWTAVDPGEGQAWNIRMYQRGTVEVLVGYRREGSLTGAHRRVEPDGKWTDQLTHRERGKADTVLSWLQEAER